MILVRVSASVVQFSLDRYQLDHTDFLISSLFQRNAKLLIISFPALLAPGSNTNTMLTKDTRPSATCTTGA
jgi:hypothetical protein